MPWLVLILASMLEIVWAVGLKKAGQGRLWVGIAAFVVANVSLLMLWYALRHLPVGTAYAVWVGLGATGVAVFGILVLGESAAWPRLFFLAIIVVGIAGLKMVEP